MAMPENSRTADKFVLRMPDGMRARIAEQAELNTRSMNSEMLVRLEASLAESAEVPTRSWTPQIGMLIVYQHDEEQTQPMEILSFDFDRYDDRSEVKLWFKVRMPSGAKCSPVYADLCQPFAVK